MKIRVITWNVENLFHPETGGPRFDLTPHEGWTLERYERKVQRVSETLATMLALSEEGCEPFVVGLTEVENSRVVADLKRHLPPWVEAAFDAGFAPDYLDCVVLYDARHFDLVACRYGQMFERYERGDATEVTLKLKSTGAELTVFCLHTKARPPERDFTEMYRQALCDELQTIIWTMHGGKALRDAAKRIKDDETPKPDALVLDRNVIVMGDFNDEPHSSSLLEYLGASHDRHFVARQRDVHRVHLFNCAWEAFGSEKPGSYYFSRSRGTPWSLLDQIVVSPALLTAAAGLRYCEGSFGIVQDLTANDRGIPARMTEWDDDDNCIWLEGYSDHFPVRIALEVCERVSSPAEG